MSIRVQNIVKNFGQFVALDHVTLDFPTGELVGLLGPSGCGKTDLSERLGLEARVERVMALGATARVEPSDADQKSDRRYEVELSRERVAELKLDAGQRVRLKPARIRLFAPGQVAEAPA